MSSYVDNVYGAMLEYVTANGGSWQALATAINRGEFGSESGAAMDALVQVYKQYGNRIREADPEGAASLSRIVNNPSWRPNPSLPTYTTSYGNPDNRIPRPAGPDSDVSGVYDEVKAAENEFGSADERAALREIERTPGVNSGLAGGLAGQIVGATAVAGGQVVNDVIKQIANSNKLEKGPLRPIGALPKQGTAEPPMSDTYDSLIAQLKDKAATKKPKPRFTTMPLPNGRPFNPDFSDPSSSSSSSHMPTEADKGKITNPSTKLKHVPTRAPTRTPTPSVPTSTPTPSVPTSTPTPSVPTSASTPTPDQGAGIGSSNSNNDSNPPQPSTNNANTAPGDQSWTDRAIDWAKSKLPLAEAGSVNPRNWWSESARNDLATEEERPTAPEPPNPNEPTDEKHYDQAQQEYQRDLGYYKKQKQGFDEAQGQEIEQKEREEPARLHPGEMDEDDVQRDYERTALTSLRPFLADAGADLFEDDEDTDKLKEQNLLMGMTKPPNWPLGNLDNKLWLQNICHDGLLQAPPLFVMPPVYKGNTLIEGAQIFGTYQHVPRRTTWKPTTFSKRLKIRC
jgi:hypothetical protein